jgi:sugar lactone lactonase YvrE
MLPVSPRLLMSVTSQRFLAAAFLNLLRFATCALLLAGAFSVPAHAAVTFAGLQTTVGSGFTQPAGVALDGAGNVFIADYGNHRVVEIPAGCMSSACQTTVFQGSGLSYPIGVAVDAAGDVFIGDFGLGQVVEVPTGGGPQTTVGIGLSKPQGVAVDGAGDVFIADYGLGEVVEVPAGCAMLACQTTVGSGLSQPTGVAVDGAGDVFIADYGAGLVWEVAFGGSQTTVGSSLSQPTGVAVDRAGDVFIADYGASQVVEVPNGGGSQIMVPTNGLLQPYSLAVDGLSNVFIADFGHSRVVEAQPVAANFGYANVCPGTQTTPTPCNQSLTLNYKVSTMTNFGTTKVATQGAPSLDFNPSGGSTCTGTVSAGTCTVNVTFAPFAPGTRMGAVQLTNTSNHLLVTTMVHGIGEGPAIAFGPGVLTTVASGLSQPTDVAEDGAGNAFIAEPYNNRVVKVPAGGGPQTTVGSGLSYPTGVAVDGAGNVFIADTLNSRVVELPANGGSQTTIGSGLSGPIGVAADGAGNIFITDSGTNELVEVPNGGSSQTVLGSGLYHPTGVAVDGEGNVFVADTGNSQVVEIPAGGGPQTTVGSGFNNPAGVAVDGAGNVLIADTGNGQVVEVPAGGGAQFTLLSSPNISTPYGMAVDGAGDVFVADAGNNQVVEVERSQPPTLSFASTVTGNTSTDSPQSVTIQNIGNKPLVASGSEPVVTGPNFSQVPGSGIPADCTSTFSLIPGATCNLSISFEPHSVAPLASTATFTDNALNALPSATQSIALQGTGLAVKSTPTTSLVSSLPSSSTYGQQVTFTATVTPTTAGPTPTGTITFTDTFNSVTTTLGLISMSSGSAALSTIALAAGSHSLVATYNGDSNYQSSISTAVTQTVQMDSSTLSLASSLNPSVFNQAVTFTASVIPAFGGNATGKVTFFDNGNPLGAPATVSGNQATLTISTLSVGPHPITASYNGDSNVSGSGTPQALVQTVSNNNANKASTTTALTSSPPSAFVGQIVTYTATVSTLYPGGVTGSVSFKSGAVSLGSALVDGSGQAAITTFYTAPGSYSITAKYAGDTNNKASTSAVLKENVTKYTTSTSVVSDQNPSSVGQMVTFTATVTPGSGGPTPTGSITFKSGGSALGTVSLTGGVANLPTSTLTVGAHNITAVYSGDATCKASTSPVWKQTVTH